MPTFDEQRASITAATDELIAKVKTPSEVSQAGVDFIRFLEDEARRVKTAFRAAKVPLPLGKGGRGKKSAQRTYSTEAAAPVTAVAAE